jgi:hypothetical protein
VLYGVPIETRLSLVNEHTLWHEHAYGFVAYEGDKPVATATAIINEGCLFLFLVAMPDGSTTKFFLDPKHPALFKFATLDGTIAASNRNVAITNGAAAPSTRAVTVVKTSDGSSYTGFTFGSINGNPHLYAANFTEARVDVYDRAFHRVSARDG